MSHRLRLSSGRPSGFSLLEVLVASAVLSIVLMILLGALTTSLSLWRTTESKLAADREGRAAELLMADDLASVFVPSDPNLWPRADDDTLQFLTLKPVDYQSRQGNNKGDVCFVEYRFDRPNHVLKRRFFGSERTFNEILNKTVPGFPNPGGGAAEAQLLATNILTVTADAVRGLALHDQAPEKSFILLNRLMLPVANNTDPPAAVEVNFAVADPDSIANQDIWKNTDVPLRNAGLYSFRIHFPQPVAAR
jgi:prepilin-type N-terminal cleavage/methylation domain-containing protein